MSSKKRPLKKLWWLLLLPLAYGISIAWNSFPIISGYGAKMMASAIYLQHRSPESVKAEELGSGPLKMGSFTWNPEDSSVTGSVMGLARRKAIFRRGYGATLVNELSENDIRNQSPIADEANPLPDSCLWPCGTKVLPADSLPEYAAARAVMAAQFLEKDAEHPLRTRGIVVIHNGRLVAEQYADGFDSNTPQLGWSMTKSLTSALIGILVKQGKLDIDAPAPVPEWQNAKDGRETITTRQLLQQTSGLKYEEEYSKPSEATNMLFKKADMAAFTASLPLREKPGSRWYYSSGNSNLLSRIVRQTAGESGYHIFPYQQLFWKTGMNSMILEPDASGTFVGSSYSWASARDWARFGLLYLQNGKWNGEQLLPEDWVAQTATPAPADTLKHYGFQWWLNAGGTYPSAPTDMLYCDGFEHQYVFVIPSRNLVVVRLGQTAGNWDGDAFLKNLLAALPRQ